MEPEVKKLRISNLLHNEIRDLTEENTRQIHKRLPKRKKMLLQHFSYFVQKFQQKNRRRKTQRNYRGQRKLVIFFLLSRRYITFVSGNIETWGKQNCFPLYQTLSVYSLSQLKLLCAGKGISSNYHYIVSGQNALPRTLTIHSIAVNFLKPFNLFDHLVQLLSLIYF